MAASLSRLQVNKPGLEVQGRKLTPFLRIGSRTTLDIFPVFWRHVRLGDNVFEWMERTLFLMFEVCQHLVDVL